MAHEKGMGGALDHVLLNIVKCLERAQDPVASEMEGSLKPFGSKRMV